MRSSVYTILFFILSASISFSQNYTQLYDGINFSIRGENSYAPFNGGANNSRFQMVDIDADNDLDLFTFDVDTSLYFYENTGNAQVPDYKLVSTRYGGIYFSNWFYFVDMDNDNDLDLFTGGEFQTMKYYKNTGTPQNANLKLDIEEIRTDSDTIIYSEANCVPVFCDIDADGDKDFFTGQSLGTVTFYQNIGSQSQFVFKFITDFWENLIIISPADGNRHGANSLEFVDINNDNDYDLFWGDLFSKGIYYIQNNGTPSDPEVAIVDSTYPPNEPFESHGYNSTRFVDIDADGDKDMFVSVLYLSDNSRNFTLYRNNGNASAPLFQRVTNDYLNNLDAGGYSNIAFTDIDSDSDRDLFIGNDFAKLSFYRNTGTANAPAFELITDSLPLLSASFNYAPAFADLDNDGDKDLLLGSYIKDSVWFYRNTGTPQNFNFVLEARGNQIGLTTLGQSSTPVFVDIDNDSDKDLFMGATNGRIFFYENTGNASNFAFTFRSSYYDSIDAGDESIPKFHDIDGDNDFDLFIGKQNGMISFYKNEGNASAPNFELQTTSYKNINVHQNACPEFADLDNDTDADLFIGNIKGGLFYFRNDEIIGINIASNSLPEKFILHQNYPNPFNPATKIKFDLPNNSFVKLSVYDITGREISVLVNQKLNTGSYEYEWNAQNLASGIYIYKLTSGEFEENRKMLLLK